MIRPDSIKNFWEMRGKKYQEVSFESIANLEESPEFLHLKIALETEKILPKLELSPNKRVLDLGAGCGQWSFRFSPYVKEVVAVEYAKAMCAIGTHEASIRNITNVNFINSSAELYSSDTPFDLVFISGLFVYLTDEQVHALLHNLKNLVAPDGMLFIRDGTSILEKRYWINEKYSEVLKTNYSAIYRTKEEYIHIFQHAGFSLQQEEQMFEEGCPLNKYPETRLWYYLFSRGE